MILLSAIRLFLFNISFIITAFACLLTTQVDGEDSETLKASEIHPLALVSAERADLMAKFIYAKHREWCLETDFGSRIYYAHLKVWNAFFEYDPPKRCFEDFRFAFDNLLDSVRNNGFLASHGLVPMGLNGILCNGAHRVTACLLYNQNVLTETTPYQCSPWGFDYFQARGLEEKYLDAMALQYCELKANCSVLIIFPSADGKENEIENIIKSFAKIVYKKCIPMTETGGLNLILTAYEQEPFVKEEKKSGFITAKIKAKQCFPSTLTAKNPVKAYLLESTCNEHVKACKKEIRALFNIGNDSVHTTDTHAEAIVMARTLFNTNSLHCLNNRKTTYLPKFDDYFDKYRTWLSRNNIYEEWFCIDGGGVLAAYGLRDCNDLDFLHHGDGFYAENEAEFDDHNHQAHHYTLSLDNILFDPDNHFYYHGIKFCSLSLLKQMKEKRREPKDRLDLLLIHQLNRKKCQMVTP